MATEQVGVQFRRKHSRRARQLSSVCLIGLPLQCGHRSLGPENREQRDAGGQGI